MSSEPAIRLTGLGKTYPIYRKPHHRLAQMLSRDKARWYREFPALRDVSLTIARGETVGIVGRNGSGKSTLLQMICGTLTPTAGELQVNGRIAALLELGAGFNPEFTGRENVYLNGSILGVGRDEMEAKFDAIAAFAEIGQFIEQPVKTYSSGMYVRLAFAVAIHVEPEILVVDEALSVGDEGFQRKCFARIDAIRDSGATVLFVSHAAGTVVDLCDRAILLDQGELIAEGTPKHVVGQYQKMLHAPAERAGALREEIKQMHRGGPTAAPRRWLRRGPRSRRTGLTASCRRRPCSTRIAAPSCRTPIF
jgi:lipopolysaccharide transport system ATP-binding protein